MYAQTDHRFCRRWAVLTDPDETLGASGAGIKVRDNHRLKCEAGNLVHAQTVVTDNQLGVRYDVSANSKVSQPPTLPCQDVGHLT